MATVIPRRIYLATAILLYVLMLGMGAIEPTVEAMPGRENFSKIYHGLFFFCLGGLFWFGLPNASVRMVTLLTAIAGAIDEFHQYFLPFRYALIGDVLIDTVAGLMAALILYHLRRQASRLNTVRQP